MCPVETPEGPNIGLITSLATYAKVSEYGFIETPYRVVDEKQKLTDEVKYFTAFEESGKTIAQLDASHIEGDNLKGIRFQRERLVTSLSLTLVK